MSHAKDLRIGNIVQVTATNKMDAHYSHIISINKDEVRVRRYKVFTSVSKSLLRFIWGRT